MRSPEHSNPAPHRAGRTFEEDLNLRYLSPGAFTILPTEEAPPDPPCAPNPYRLTPTAKRNKNQSFSIIAEPISSRPVSRSSSPTGRVSPFRGRGFNPIGSRHASPNPSPPPEDVRLTPVNQSPRHSKIPTLRKNVFGEKISHIGQFRSPQKRLHTHLSQSLTDLEPKGRKNLKPVAFQRLSPIVGSSPEPSQSQSSPSRIPKSRSQPSSRLTSPIRAQNAFGKPPTGHNSRTPSRKTSRNRNQSSSTSREPSPSKLPTSPQRRYRNVPAKVNSFSRPKPKILPKPPVTTTTTTTEQSEDSDALSKNKKVVKKDSINRMRNITRSSLLAKNSFNNKNSASNNNNNNKNNKSNNSGKELTSRNSSNNLTAKASNGNEKETSVKSDNLVTDSELTEDPTALDTNLSTEEEKVDSKLQELMQPSTETVVSTTTSTVTQPLKIEAKIEAPIQYDKPKPVSPMVDGRVLSATSVSHAINKMNDTVLDTKTLISDRGFSSKMSAVNAIVSMSNETPKNALDKNNLNKTINEEKEKVKTEVINNHVTHVGILEVKDLQNHVRQPGDGMVGFSLPNQKNANERMREARTVIAADVKPIRINVKEKPLDVEVQSGNVRLPTSATNGISELPSLPPQTPPEAENKPVEKENACKRFFTSCKSKIPCSLKKKTEIPTPPQENEEEEKRGCFPCCKKNKENKDQDRIRINVDQEQADLEEPKKGFFAKLKCCGKNKVKDSGSCFSRNKKEDWSERRDSILSSPEQEVKKSKCSSFFSKLFCLHLCSKKNKEEEELRRKASVVSKKKSLTPTTAPPPPPEEKPKLDLSLVEHTSHMKAAIPVLPVALAWFCLVMNCIAPGTGTVLSGMFCLCLGKPRFSQKDGIKPRIGSFLINIIIGIGQCFTVLFCLVGWGWSIWWGLIMLRVARKHKKIKNLEVTEEQSYPQGTQNHRDPERGR